MSTTRFHSIIVTLSLLVVGTMTIGAPFVVMAQTVSEKTANTQQSFLIALAAADAAQRELQSGNAAAYKAIWSRSDDVTLIGGFGGGVEKGWSKVSQRIDWVASQFSNGTNTIERLVTHSNENIGYVVQIERIRFQVPGQAKESTRDYRVTMLFSREPDGWKLLHRHADSQMMKQAP
jgi:ketosteroid isomerase-like protein